MKKTTTLFTVLLLLVGLSASAQMPAYKLFNHKGKKSSYKKMMKKLKKADIILFGEFHNNPISHWLQLQVTQDLSGDRQLILGAEMFEADNQTPLSQYVAGEISVEELDSLARLWPNYTTDYKPLVNFAKDNKLDFVATNIPRRYAKIVFRQGFEGLDTLSTQEKAWIAPLPVAYDAELPGYKAMLEMMGGHGGENFPKAQAIKDATMSHFILQHYKSGMLFIHYNGAYHSDNYEGIGWYLKQANPELNIVTISTVSQPSVKKLDKEHKGRADFIINVPENMTTTY